MRIGILLLTFFIAEISSATISLYHSDSCSSTDFIGVVGSKSDCGSLGISTRVYGVSVDGKCTNVSDTDAVNICRRFRGNDITFYHSDTCSTDPIASMDAGSDCGIFNGISERAYAVQVDGVCSDISDRTVVKACLDFGGQGAR
jgi:hypothetical protein